MPTDSGHAILESTLRRASKEFCRWGNQVPAALRSKSVHDQLARLHFKRRKKSRAQVPALPHQTEGKCYGEHEYDSIRLLYQRRGRRVATRDKIVSLNATRRVDASTLTPGTAPQQQTPMRKDDEKARTRVNQRRPKLTVSIKQGIWRSRPCSRGKERPSFNSSF